MTERENEVLDMLLSEHGERAAVTRRDPGESGPLLVEINGNVWEIQKGGKVKSIRPGRAA